MGELKTFDSYLDEGRKAKIGGVTTISSPDIDELAVGDTVAWNESDPSVGIENVWREAVITKIDDEREEITIEKVVLRVGSRIIRKLKKATLSFGSAVAGFGSIDQVIKKK